MTTEQQQQQDHEQTLPASETATLWHSIGDIQGTLRSMLGRLDRIEENQRETNRRIDRLINIGSIASAGIIGALIANIFT